MSAQKEEFVGGVHIQISSDKKSHTRSVYSLLDFFGDVGGLLSILLSMG